MRRSRGASVGRGRGVRKDLSLGLVLSFLLAPAWCLGATHEWCPATVQVEQKASLPPAPWSVSYRAESSTLEMVTFFNGPPEEMASLVYDKTRKIKRGWVGIWNFPRDERGYWIRCAYQGTRAELSRKLPDAITGCRVSYDGDIHSVQGLPAIRAIDCR